MVRWNHATKPVFSPACACSAAGLSQMVCSFTASSSARSGDCCGSPMAFIRAIASSKLGNAATPTPCRNFCHSCAYSCLYSASISRAMCSGLPASDRSLRSVVSSTQSVVLSSVLAASSIAPRM